MSVLAKYLGGARAGALASGKPLAGMNPMAAMTEPQGENATDLMGIASSALGMNETDQAAAIQDYLKTGGANLDPATTAWCAAFVNATLKKGGYEGTGSNMARSFLDWGQEVDKPTRGDLAVFSRGDPNGPYGHVGFFEGYNPDGTIKVLGGNQGDAVSYASYSPDALLGFRRAANPLATYARN